MQISEIRVKLTDDPRNKLKAYCSVTFANEFVIRDLKIIEGAKGPFVAMPSRKLSDHCPYCGCKNHLRAGFCNQCGKHLNPDRAPRDQRGRARLHADLAHPINSSCRIELHRAIVRAFQDELDRSKQAGYQPVSFDDLDELDDHLDESYLEELQHRQEVRDRERRHASPGDERVQQGETRSAEHDGSVSRNDGRMSQSEARMSQNEGRVSQSEARMSQNEDRVSQSEGHTAEQGA